VGDPYRKVEEIRPETGLAIPKPLTGGLAGKGLSRPSLRTWKSKSRLPCLLSWQAEADANLQAERGGSEDSQSSHVI
jgi:hypothetical protein